MDDEISISDFICTEPSQKTLLQTYYYCQWYPMSILVHHQHRNAIIHVSFITSLLSRKHCFLPRDLPTLRPTIRHTRLRRLLLRQRRWLFLLTSSQQTCTLIPPATEATLPALAIALAKGTAEKLIKLAITTNLPHQRSQCRQYTRR